MTDTDVKVAAITTLKARVTQDNYMSRINTNNCFAYDSIITEFKVYTYDVYLWHSVCKLLYVKAVRPHVPLYIPR